MQNAEKPNVLFIIDDQHRGDWMGCAGADFIQTPNLDRLAERGRMFTHCYTNSPVCAPARCSLASGLLPSRLGAMSNNTAFLPMSTPNMYRHFRDHGYRVSLVGRHDLAKTGAPASVTGDRPLNYSYGFTEAFEVEGGMALSILQEPNGPYGQYLKDQGLWDMYREDFTKRRKAKWILGQSHDSVLDAEHHQDAFIIRKAIDRIHNIPRDYPWFMFVSFQSPHDPFDPPQEMAELYRDADIPDPITSDLESKSRRTYWRRDARIAHGQEADPDQVREARRQYAAKITWIDTLVGQMLDALEESGQSENTIVVFCSDHGEMAGDHELWIKQVALEPSWHVPLIVAGPGVQAGTSDALVELSDLNPTVTELAGLPAQEKLDAKSFASVVRGESTEHRDAVVTMEGDVGADSYAAIRTHNEKLIMNTNDQSEFYDLEADPDERENIIDQRLERARTLRFMFRNRLIEDRWMR